MTRTLLSWTIALGLIVCSTMAAAQSVSERVSEATVVSSDLFIQHTDGTRVYTANISNCREMISKDVTLTFKWTLISAYTDTDLRYALKVQRPEQTCDTTSSAADGDASCTVIYADEPVGNADSFLFDIDAQTIFGFTDPALCEGRSEDYDIIFVLPYIPPVLGDDTDKTHEPDVLRLALQTTRPYAPGDVTVTAGGSSIHVKWTKPTKAKDYIVYYSTSPLMEGAVPEQLGDDVHSKIVSIGTSVTITDGISQDNTYYVALVSRDTYGNKSLLSPIAQATTEETIDFWEDYLNNGGQEHGGYCASMPASEGGFLAFFVFIGLLWRRSTARRAGCDA